MTYRLWWTVGYVCTTEKEFRAAKHRLLPAAYEALDDALPRAPDGTPSGVAVSFGIACFPEDTTQGSELVAIADASLYRSKRRRKELLAAAGGGH